MDMTLPSFNLSLSFYFELMTHYVLRPKRKGPPDWCAGYRIAFDNLER